ncbi:MAG: BTAD domain-containing putative transcriptional regulator, partial [Anaerolineae bacterium]|nr:BTAD domain-containing putative transcriptional regulator [Anaerolineae bacterium]
MGLDVRLLGQFNLQFAGQEIVIPSRPAQSLFAYLVLNAGASHRRERLAGLLWPDASDANARSYLRKALWLIRKSFLGAAVPWQSYLHADEIAITFDRNADYWLDAELITEHQALETTSIGELIAAVATFRGELLPGFYDEWIVLERERVQVCFDQRMRCLLDRLVVAGRWEEVVEWGERWISFGHTPEPAYRSLMMAHAGVGDLAGVTAVYRRCEEALLRELGVRPSAALEDTYQRLSRREAPGEPLAGEQREQWEAYEQPPRPGEPPYKGLAFFDVADAGLFFGREKLAARLAGHLLDHALLAVVGASGSGKSSVLRAGLVPTFMSQTAVRDVSGVQADDRAWLATVLTPTDHPLQALAAAVGEGGAAGTPALPEALAQNPHYLTGYLQEQLAGHEAAGVLLVVDQFEELFTLCRDETERKAFIDNLLWAVGLSGPDGTTGPIRIVIGLRADFYAHCADYPRLAHLLAENQEYVTPMSPEELRRAIEEPARRNGWLFQPGLVDLLMRETRGEPGALPLLSHVLLESWRRRSGPAMMLKGYAESGGVRGAIAKTAQQVYFQRLTAQQQALARNIFLRLTSLGEETQATRRRAEIAELVLSPGNLGAVQEVLGILAEARLVTLGEHTAEVAHEALIREWPALRQWLAEDRQGLLLHRHLTDAAQEWEAIGRDEGELYRGARLEQALSWSSANRDRLNPLEMAFLAASRGLAKRRAAEREAERQRELEAARRLADIERRRAEEGVKSANRLRRRAYLIASVGVAAVILAALAFYAWQLAESQAALNHSLSLASAAQLANEASQGDLALALALEAVKGDQPPPEALVALRSVATSPGTRLVLSGHRMEVRSAAISPDNQRAFSGSCATENAPGDCQAGELILWDLAAGKELRRWSAHTGWVNAVAFSLDGQALISAAEDGLLIQWDAETGEEIRQLAGHRGSVTSLAVEADTGALLSGSADGTLILWELKTGSILWRSVGESSPVNTLAVASAEPVAVSGHADGALTLWDLNSPQPVRSIEGNGHPVNAVAVSHDGSWILSTAGFELRKINSKTGEVERSQDWGGMPDEIALSADQSFALLDRSVLTRFDLQNWRERWLSSDTYYDITALSISQDQLLVLVGYSNGTVRLFDLVPQLDYQRFETGLDADAIATSPDGKTLLLGNMYASDRNLVLWDIANAQVVRKYNGFDGSTSPESVAISPDGRLVAAGGGYFTQTVYSLVVWILESGEVQCRFDVQNAMPRSVAFSPDSRWLLAGTQAIPRNGLDELILWDVQSCQRVRRFDMDSQEDVTGIAFSADGQRAITGAAFPDPNRIILWDVSTGREIRRFVLPRSGLFAPILDVAFGPGDRTILGADLQSLCVWDVETGEMIRCSIGHTSFPWSVDISPDGKYILSGSDNEVILWDFSSGQEQYRLSAHEQPVY